MFCALLLLTVLVRSVLENFISNGQTWLVFPFVFPSFFFFKGANKENIKILNITFKILKPLQYSFFSHYFGCKRLRPKSYTSISTLLCTTLTVSCTNFHMGRVVQNHALLSCAHQKRRFDPPLFFLFLFLNSKLQTDGKRCKGNNLSHVNQTRATTLMPD